MSELRKIKNVRPVTIRTNDVMGQGVMLATSHADGERMVGAIDALVDAVEELRKAVEDVASNLVTLGSNTARDTRQVRSRLDDLEADMQGIFEETNGMVATLYGMGVNETRKVIGGVGSGKPIVTEKAYTMGELREKYQQWIDDETASSSKDKWLMVPEFCDWLEKEGS